MPDDFVIARNPDGDSSLPYLVRIPLGAGILLKSRETWPRTAKVFCHRVEEWPSEPDVVERVSVRSRTRRGAAIDRVLSRRRRAGRGSSVAFPNVPVLFCETRKLAQEWTYRFLAAAYAATELDILGAATVAGLAQAHGYAVSDRGRIPAAARSAYQAAATAG